MKPLTSSETSNTETSNTEPFQLLLKKLYSFAWHFVAGICLLLSAGLFLSAFLWTCYSEDMESQLVLTKWDNPLLNLLSLLLFFFLFGCITRGVCRNPARYKRLLLWFTLCLTGMLGLILILFGRSMPTADAMSVFGIAERFAMGDMGAIHPTESYLSYYPQQIGLIAFYEPIIRLWKLFFKDLAAYHFIKCIYVGLVWVIIFFQYKAVQLLWQDDRTDCLYLLLAGLNLPLVFYSSFVYGEIPSFAALTTGLYFLLRFLKAQRDTEAPFQKCLSYALFSLFFLTLSVMLRKNSLILIIAVVLVVLLEGGRAFAEAGKNRNAFRKACLLPAFALLCAVCSVRILPTVQHYYEMRAHNTLRSGVTATSYFAMGMQESSRGNGWYNGFNFYTYQDTGLDTERTNEIAKAAIAERLQYFKEHPGYAANFYWYKYLSQWADGTYACRQATLMTSGGRYPVFVSIYQGDYSKYVLGWCNAYQNVLYLGTLLFLLGALGKHKFQKSEISQDTLSEDTSHKSGISPDETHTPKNTGTAPAESDESDESYELYCFIGLIGVLGGFLFHMLWEANSRYIFLYGLLLLPYGAAGLSRLLFMTEKRTVKPNPIRLSKKEK